ncbi:chitobiase/beta-hexosaminidase C-terminal domain-containing protein [Prevotella communis]|uniref:chitobiase/beta-hexosaminidase C-terminal domain-containing protein n=1 Tax=Prevotella communis TaxID=2913614 RepID=UPI001EDA8C30|nr:FN3 associated domain-containing protein [Prevotella communis]UKK62424.1 chitobiase/beta-hexosaminidase C-terminal domain-containing protein [Prevotella communis]UKK65249.1 chitobiase/beta-hexosaminidase C-terminal domain-containing protein [Prevotella communis]
MKHFNLLKTTLLLCALIVGSLSGWAEETTATLDMTKAQTSPVVVNGVTFSWTSSYIITGAASDASNGFGGKSGTADMTITIPEGKKLVGISKVNGNNWGSTNINVYAGTDTKGSLVTEIKQSTNSYTISTNNTGSTYYLVTSAKKNAWIKSLTIQYDDASTSGKKSVDAPTFSPAAGAITAGTTVTLTQATADEIRYTLDGTNPTKTTGTVYSSPIEITTPTTIKAIAVKGDDVSSVIAAEYTINVNSPEFNILSQGNYLNGTEVTLASAGNTIYYTTDNTTPTSSSIQYSSPISLDGKMTIKAIAYDSYGNSSGVVTRTMTGIAPATLPFSWAGGTTTEFTSMTGVIGGSLGNYSDNNRPYLVQMDKTGDYIEIFMDAKPIKLAIGVKMIGGGSTSKITVQESVNGVDFSDVEELTISGSQNSVVNLETSEDFSATTRVLKLLFTKGSNIGVGPISITSETSPVSISAAGFATFVSDFDLDYSSVPGLKAYKATVDGVTISFDKVTTVPAGEGVLLQGDEGTYDVPLTSGVTPWADDDNAFVRGTGAAVATGDGPYNYILNKVNGVVGFYKANGQTVAKNRAYLQSMTAAARISLNFDEETTGVSEVAKSDVNNKVFDLQGRHIAQPTKGLYIMNGRKVLVK